MTKDEAIEYAKDMSYRDAVYNALQGKSIPYRKATLIKLHELLDIADMDFRQDIRIAIAGWYYAMNDEWCGEGDAFDDEENYAFSTLITYFC